MYQEHPSFQPISDDAKIWRFMDFAKFCAMLEKQALFFIKPEKFQDPWEGYSPKRHYEEGTYQNLSAGLGKALVRAAKESALMARRHFAVNCWHINTDESEAFWKNYEKKGVAIQTTFARLRESFKSETDYDVYIGKVEYKNHETDTIDPGNVFNSILWKRRSFEHEQELRAAIWARTDKEGKGFKSFADVNGQYVKSDLGVLIEKVYTTPFEDGVWFTETVQGILARYGLKVPCVKSPLMEGPAL